MNAGDVVAVHRHSGCGKSTLLLPAGGLMHPDSGSVCYGDTDIYSLSGKGRAAFRLANIGVVFQQFHLIPYLTVIDGVTSPSLSGSISGLRRKASDILDTLGMGHRPSELSVGEQQRVALARAVMASPKFLVADEPTGNLDTENGRVVLEFFSDFSQNGGIVFMVSHDDRAIATATRTVGMKKGFLS